MIYILLKLFWTSARWAINALLLGLFLTLTFPEFTWKHELFHAIVESAGALIGFGLAFVIYTMIVRGELPKNFVWLIACFISMSILDIAHSFQHPGQLFVWFHSLATFVGGIFACQVWRTPETSKKYLSQSYLIFLVILTICVVMSSYFWPQNLTLPMLNSFGKFTVSAELLNFTGGLGFIAAWLYFAREYHQNCNPDSPYFSNYFFLFGLAGLIFELSALWNGNWWLWHMLRGFSYLLLLTHFVTVYQKKMAQQLHDTEQNLQKSENRFHSIVETSPDWIWEVDANGIFTYVSPRIYGILGYHPEDVIGKKTPFDLMPKEEAERVGAVFADIVKGCRTFHGLENINLHRLGHPIILETSGTPILSEDGTLLGYNGVVRDISKRKKTEDSLKESQEKISLLLNSTAEGIFGMDNEGICTFVNPACLQMLGYQDENQLIGKDIHSLLHYNKTDGQYYPIEESPIYIALKKGEGVHVDNEVFWHRGEYSIPVEYWSYPILKCDKIIGSVTTFIDITERKKSEDEKKKILHEMEERVKELHCMYEITQAIRKYNSLEEILLNVVRIIPTGWRYPEFTRARIVFDEKEITTDPFELTQWKQTGELIINSEYRGIIEVYYTRRFPILDEGPFLNHERNLINGISKTLSGEIERHEADVYIQHLATHDPLTDIYNRTTFEKRILYDISRAKRYNHSLSILMLDIDHFKKINDTYGHHIGDIVLCNFSEVLKTSLRDTDYVVRYGGEEFIIVLPETELNKAKDYAERLRNIIAEDSIVIAEDKVIYVTVSIGVSNYPEHGHDWQELVEAADNAMYVAKNCGRNQIKTAST